MQEQAQNSALAIYEMIVSSLLSHNSHHSGNLAACSIFRAEFFTGHYRLNVSRKHQWAEGLTMVNLGARKEGEYEYTQVLHWNRFTAIYGQRSSGFWHRSKASLHPGGINLKDHLLELLLDCLKLSSWFQCIGIIKEKKEKTQLIPG